VPLGPPFAPLHPPAPPPDAVVAWAPVVSGRRYAKEIRLLSEAVPSEGVPSGTDQAVVVSAGTVFTERTLADIAALSLSHLVSPCAARVLLVDEVRHDELCALVRETGAEVQQREVLGGESALESPAEYATVPEEIVGTICDWVGHAQAGPGEPSDRPSGAPARIATVPAAPDRTVASFSWSGSPITERVVRLGAARFAGVLTEPRASAAHGDADGDHPTVVFLNSGSEPHIGPGRAWVEYARELATSGHRCLRVDFRGWGESPDDGHAPGRPYDPHCEEDAIAIVRALRELGHERIVLVGLCASAWVALRAALREPVTCVIALNPQMYWKMGDPVEATMAETRERRTAERERERRGARLGLWTLLDRLGRRPWAGRWLDELSATATPVVLAFAAGDDGIEFLRTRLGRRLRMVQRTGQVRVLEMPAIDHSMHRAWLRPSVVRMLREQIDSCAAVA
jgi:pimeloyl-ACP methyl ester carboxylesterase